MARSSRRILIRILILILNPIVILLYSYPHINNHQLTYGILVYEYQYSGILAWQLVSKQLDMILHHHFYSYRIHLYKYTCIQLDCQLYHYTGSSEPTPDLDFIFA